MTSQANQSISLKDLAERIEKLEAAVKALEKENAELRSQIEKNRALSIAGI